MVELRLSPCGGEKKTKKKRGGKNSFLGGRKKHSLKKMASCGCLVRFLRVCFFCAVAVFLLSVVKKLFSVANFLIVGRNFLLDVVHFLFAGLSCQRAVKNFGLSG